MMTDFSRNHTFLLTFIYRKMDPFIAFEYEGKKFRTKVAHDGGRNPHWLEVIDLVNLILGEIGVRNQGGKYGS